MYYGCSQLVTSFAQKNLFGWATMSPKNSSHEPSIDLDLYHGKNPPFGRIWCLFPSIQAFGKSKLMIHDDLVRNDYPTPSATRKPNKVSAKKTPLPFNVSSSRLNASILPKMQTLSVKIFVLVVVSNIVYFHPYLGKITILTNIFQRG